MMVLTASSTSLYPYSSSYSLKKGTTTADATTNPASYPVRKIDPRFHLHPLPCLYGCLLR